MALHVTTSDLADASAAHIHQGFAGMTGGVAIGLEQDAVDPSHWSVESTFTQEQFDALEAGGLYVNVHSPANPGGEIRSQLAPDNITVLVSNLSGNNEVPAVNTTATGQAGLTVNTDTMDLVLHVTTSDLDDATAAHIHAGFAGTTGGVAIGLEADPDNVTHWSVASTFSEEQYADLWAGGLYVNVHSPANPGGEIRGQLLPSNISVIWASLNGDNEVPAVVTPASGRAALTVNTDTMDLVLHARTSGLDDATAAHIHQGFAGTTGGVAIGLAADPDNVDRWSISSTFSEEQYADLWAGGLYVNVHSPANPGGEIRGPLLPSNISVIWASLNGDNEVPAVVTSASGRAALTVNTDTMDLVLHARTSGLDDATAAHIHQGFAGTTGGVAIGLAVDPDNASRWSASGTFTQDQYADLWTGGLYVNVHSPANPGGEIRGQLTPNNITVLVTNLSGGNEVPAVTTTASGQAGLTVNTDTMELVLHVTTSNFTDATAAHIHQGLAGTAGGVAIGLEADPDNVNHWSVTSTFSAEQYADLWAGGLYVNVHSPANPGGEIRGQIAPDNITVLVTSLSGNNEVPAVNTIASGQAGLTVNTDTMELTLHVSTINLDDASAAHIHQGFAGTTGGVAIGLEMDPDDASHWSVIDTFTEQQYADLWAGGLYVNVHSPANPGGEIRGPLAPDNITVLIANLTGDSEVPAVDTTASGVTGLTVNTDTMDLVLHATVSGLDDATAAHIHQGFAGTTGGVAIGLALDPDNMSHWSVSETFTEEQYADLWAGGLYVNVHSPANPGGELRGQLLPGNITVIWTDLSGANEVPAVVTTATGRAALTVNSSTMDLVLHAMTSDLDDATAAHIHQGFAGTTGGVAIGLILDPDNPSHWSVSSTFAEEQYADLWAGGLYVNVHSPANPGGELRGQLLPSNITVIWTDLSGDSEVPAVVTTATDRAALTVNSSTMDLVLHAMTTDLDDATAAHIHQGFAGTTGGVAIGLVLDPDNPSHWSVSSTFTGEQYADLWAGGLYVNVHSPANPGGELRGQLLPSNITVIWTDLSGDSEVPAVVTTATGRAALTVNTSTMDLVLHAMTGNLDDATAAHIHQGFAGITGGVAIGLVLDPDNPSHWSVTSTFTGEQYADLWAGGLYVNVHSPANPGGELRGQLLPGNITVIWTDLSGDNEVPAVVTTATGRAALTVNTSTMDLVLHAVTTGLADATAAHIHQGLAGATGGVAIGLEQDVENWSVVATFTEDQYADLWASGLYVNVHSPANPGGEIRGQLIP